MGDEKQCADLPGTVLETYVLVFEFAGAEIKNAPEQLGKVLTNPKVQAKIKESLQKRLDELQKKALLSGRPIDSQQALEEVQSVFTVDTIDASTEELKKLIEQTPKYKQLMSSLDDVSCKFKKSPRGFFYDEAAGIFVVVCTGLMIAGAAGAYIAATGDSDTVGSIGAALSNKVLQGTIVGKLEMGVADVVIKPSEKKYDVGLFARVKEWKRIEKAEVKVTVQTKDEKVAALPISVETKVRITPGWFNNFGATYEPFGQKATFSLGISGENDVLKVQVKANYAYEPLKQSVGGSGSVNWKPIPKIPIDITGGVGYDRITEQVPINPAILDGPSNTKQTNDLRFNLGLKYEF